MVDEASDSVVVGGMSTPKASLRWKLFDGRRLCGCFRDSWQDAVALPS
jgi:hypothetical protein